jgi:hypothetical protein
LHSDWPQVEGAAILGLVLLGLRLLETLKGPRGNIHIAVHEAPMNINGYLPCLPMTLDIGNSVIIEDGVEESICKLLDLREQFSKSDDVFFYSAKFRQWRRGAEKNGEKSKTSDTSVAHSQASIVLNMCTKYLLAAITEIQLLGFPSFFTSVVLHANR